MTTTVFKERHRVVIIGGGFGGLYAAKNLEHEDIDVTLVDRRNYHLFQPLLYQVATGGLSPGDISSPLRAVLNRLVHTRVVQGDVIDIEPDRKAVILRDGEIRYDSVIVATGVSHHYFGNDEWAAHAPGLKTIEDALKIRRRIFLAFETAEREEDPRRRMNWMQFVIVGAGPTGVELAGAVAELARHTLRRDFRTIDPTQAEIYLVEGMDRVLPGYPATLSAKAERSLDRLGVHVMKNSRVTGVDRDGVVIKDSSGERRILARTVLWAAGVQASPIGQVLGRRFAAKLDRAGRVHVEPDLTIVGHPDVVVIGDLSHCSSPDGESLPGVAPVAMQQGRYAARLIIGRLRGTTPPPFRYNDKGSLAVIGRNAAVADLGRLRFAGRMAWFMWLFIHIAYLIEFDNKLLVMIQWAFDYFTRKRGARLITGRDPHPLLPSRGTGPQGRRSPDGTKDHDDRRR